MKIRYDNFFMGNNNKFNWIIQIFHEIPFATTEAEQSFGELAVEQ